MNLVKQLHVDAENILGNRETGERQVPPPFIVLIDSGDFCKMLTPNLCNSSFVAVLFISKECPSFASDE